MALQGDYDWSQRLDQIIVNIPLKGTNPKNADILGKLFGFLFLFLF